MKERLPVGFMFKQINNIFDQDYLGEHRGVAAMPGPFADGAEAEKILW